MKTNTFKITAIMLMLTGSFSSCVENEGKMQDIALQYQKCECDREIQNVKKVAEENVLLLDTEKVTYNEILEMSRNSKEEFKYIICDFTLKEAVYRVPHPLPPSFWWPITGFICNFPFDFSWDIPKNGVYASFTADQSQSCHGWSPDPETSITDLVLTSLKIQTK